MIGINPSHCCKKQISTRNFQRIIFIVFVITLGVLIAWILSSDNTANADITTSLIGSPPGNKVDPGDTAIYRWEVSNDGNGMDNITIEIPEIIDNETNVPQGWIIMPIPRSFSLDSAEKREVDLEVEVDEDEEPGTVDIEVWFWYHNDTEKSEHSFTVIVNQSYDISTNLNFNLLEIFPGHNDSAILTVKNTGTGVDFYKIEISNIPEITARVEPSLTDNVDPGETITIDVSFWISGGMEPDTVTFWINVTSQGAEEKDIEVMDTSSIDIEIKDTFGSDLNKEEGTYQVSPTHEQAGTTLFNLTVINEGSTEDTFNFEFTDDMDTRKYKKWITLPARITLDPKASQTATIEIWVEPVSVDPAAVAEGFPYNVTIRVYSEGARDNNVEIAGETTADFLCHILIEEYRHALFTSVVPASITMHPDDVAYINVTMKNLGNGNEQYFFIKDGENGSGQNKNWYEFNVSSILLEPFQSGAVMIIVSPPGDAQPGDHDLEFHARSETPYITDVESFGIYMEEKFGGKFVSGSDNRSDPGESVNMEVTVANTGNDDHYFYLDDPNVPEGWTTSWSGGNFKSIQAYSSSVFTLRIHISTDYTKVEAGLYQFNIYGDYETEAGGRAELPGFAYLNLTINKVYDVEVKADDVEEWAEPGDTVMYRVEVRNSGNTNDSYVLSISKAQGKLDAKDWATILDVDPSGDITLLTGETAFLDVQIHVPDFTPDNDAAKFGDYGILFKTKSTNVSGHKGETDIILELHVEEIYKVKAWSDFPGKNETLKENDNTEMAYTIYVRNLGNTDDEILVTVPNDEFSGDKRDWKVRFGTQPSQTLMLDSLAQELVTLKIIIDKSTDPGEYILKVRAESHGESSVYDYTTIYLNLSKPSYGLELKKVPSSPQKVNPADESEVEFRFTLTNTGNQDDSYTIDLETLLSSGTYKDWEIEFENKADERVDEINVPSDLKGQTENILNSNEKVDITLYVKVALDEEEGFYGDITISATSDNDMAQVDFLYFNLTVILPNIRLSADLKDFNIDPDKNIEEDDSIDINLRVYNDGSAGTDRFYVFFYNGKKNSPNENAGSNFIAFEKIDNIPANSYFDVLATWDDIEGGDNDIYAIADKPIRSGIGATKDPKGNFLEDGLVSESRENDNSISIAQKYKDAVDLRPDLTIIHVEFDDYEEGEKTTVTVTIGNVGSAKALRGSAEVKLKIGGISIKDKMSNRVIPTIPDDIEVDDDIDMDFVWYIEDAWNFTVKASVKHPDDSNTGNDRLNTFVITIESDDGIDYTPGFISVLCLVGIGVLIVIIILAAAFIHQGNRKENIITAKPIAGPAPPSTTSALEPKVAFPVVDNCPDCGIKLRAKKPGLIRCPFCKAIAVVTGLGFFLPRDNYKLEYEALKFAHEQDLLALQKELDILKSDSDKVVSEEEKKETELQVMMLEEKIASDKEKLEKLGEEEDAIEDAEEVLAKIITAELANKELKATPKEDSELDRKIKELTNYVSYENYPDFMARVPGLLKQIKKMECYASRCSNGFPKTSFVARTKEELNAIKAKPKALRTTREKAKFISYRTKIRAFESLIGMPIEKLLEELATEELLEEFEEEKKEMRIPPSEIDNEVGKGEEDVPEAGNDAAKGVDSIDNTLRLKALKVRELKEFAKMAKKV